MLSLGTMHFGNRASRKGGTGGGGLMTAQDGSYAWLYRKLLISTG